MAWVAAPRRIAMVAAARAGIDMALRVVARLCGARVARETARHMEYPYPENDRRRL